MIRRNPSFSRDGFRGTRIPSIHRLPHVAILPLAEMGLEGDFPLYLGAQAQGSQSFL